MYTVDYFIQKFEAIPEELWLVRQFQGDGGEGCVNGHAQRIDIYAMGELTRLFRGNIVEKCEAPWQGCYMQDFAIQQCINNGDHPDYQQPTPKQRILAALYDIKKMQQPQYPDLTQSLAVLPIEETSDVVKVKEVVK